MNRTQLFALVFSTLLFGSTVQADPIVAESVVLQLLDEAEIAAGEAGLLIHLDVSEGVRVKRGQVLARIDDMAARINEQGAKAELTVAKAEVENDVSIRYAVKALEVAKTELQRSLDSVARFPTSVSQAQIDIERLKVDEMTLEKERAEHERRLAKLRVDVAQSKLDAAKLEVRRRQVISPLDARAVSVEVNLGEWVEPGQKIVRLVSTQRLKAEGFVTAAQAASGIEEASVTVEIDGSDRTFEGKIVFVSPEVDPINQQVRVWAEVPNSQALLRPGQPVRMTIHSTAPASANPPSN